MFVKYKNTHGEGKYDCYKSKISSSFKRDIVVIIVLFVLILLSGKIIEKNYAEYYDVANYLTIGVYLVGCSLIFIKHSIIESITRKKRCNYNIEAEIYDVKIITDTDSDSNNIYKYSPVYKYIFKEKEYITELAYSSMYLNKELGKKEMIHINPDNPIEFFIDEEKKKGFIFLLVTVFMIVGIVLIRNGIKLL